MFGIRRAAERYSEIRTHHCTRCGAFAGSECIDGHTGKKRRVPHKERIEAAQKAPRARRKAPATGMTAQPTAAAPTAVKAPRTKSSSKPPKITPRPTAHAPNAVHGIIAGIAAAFDSR